MEYLCHYDSPLGGMTMASDGRALVGLWFDRQRDDRQRYCSAGADALVASSRFGAGPDPLVASSRFGAGPGPLVASSRLPVFEETCRWLDVYFAGGVPDFTPPLALHGTPFRKAVWEILLTIPYGKTMTYGEIAARIAEQRGRQRLSAQAVGGAVGHNPVAIIVPCHRVIGADGSLTGYAAGLDKKHLLLQLEQIID
jgi:methylated-DNA-[protein]-cysteine S-methyltransferase